MSLQCQQIQGRAVGRIDQTARHLYYLLDVAHDVALAIPEHGAPFRVDNLYRAAAITYAARDMAFQLRREICEAIEVAGDGGEEVSQ